MPAAETRVPCSKEARTMLNRHKDAEHTTYDAVIRKLVDAYESGQNVKSGD